MAVHLKHWGEMETPRSSRSVPDLSSDDVNFLIHKSYATEITKDDPLLGYGNQELKPESSAMDCEVLNTVKLQQHAAVLRQLIAVAKTRIAPGQHNQPRQHLPNAPPLPEIKHRPWSHPRVYPIGFLTSSHTPFTLGEPSHPETLSPDANRQVLSKSVSTLVAQAGWDVGTFCGVLSLITQFQRQCLLIAGVAASSEEALGVLRDVADDFLRRLTGLLRVAVDREILQGGCGFPDSVEQVFHTMGLGSIRSLHYYYQRQVLGHQDNIRRICHSLSNEYMQLSSDYNKDLPQLSWETLSLKEEMKPEGPVAEEGDQDVPELHFPGTADGDMALQPSASLQTGFEMLVSLERQQLLSEDDVDLDGIVAEEDDIDVGETANKSQPYKKKHRT